MDGLTPPRALVADDDLGTFDCGRDSLNLWLRRHALRNQQIDVSRTSLVFDRASGLMAGYVSLSAAQIARGYLPKPSQRNRPDPIPAVLMGQLAVDLRFRGRGYARALLLFAMRTSLRLSEDIGCWGLLTHPLDDNLRAFYARFGFATLPFDPAGSMAVRIADMKASGI